MERGITQILFHFVPEKTFVNPIENAIEKVYFIEGKEITDPDSIKYITNRILASIKSYLGKSTGFPQRETSYIILKPERVKAELFPLVFRCKKCGVVYDFSMKKEILKEGIIKCNLCNGNLVQIHHIMICPECSNIENIRVPHCKTHGKKYIILDDSSERYKNFKWICKKCNKLITKGLHRYCQCGENMEASVHTARKAYITHHFTTVNIPHREYSNWYDEKSKIALGAYFGVFNHPERKIDDIIHSLDTSAIKKIVNSKKFTDSDRMKLWEIIGNYEEENEKDEIINKVINLLNAEEIDISQNMLEYVYMLENINVIKLDNLIENSMGYVKSKINGYKEKIEKYGIDDIYLTSDFPLLTVVYGYHRTYEDFEEKKYPRLKSFPNYADGRTPVYYSQNETEGIIIKMDPLAIVRWLQKNNVIDVDIDKMEISQIRAFLYKNMQRIKPYENVENLSLITRYVHGLLHTISHLLIKQGSIFSGIETTSLAEYIFPDALTFIIYSNRMQSFTIGGLFTLVEMNLLEWIDNAKLEGQLCIYDPVCARRGGSCHACTHINELSCQFFNNNLNRAYLFGKEAGNIDIQGFWEKI